MRVCAFLSVVLFQVLLSVWSSRCELYEPHLDKDESNDLINLNQLDSNELKHDQKLKNFFDIFSNRQNINDQLLYQDGLGSFNNLLYKKPIKRSRLIKKTKPITHNGYSLDINVENFKSMVLSLERAKLFLSKKNFFKLYFFAESVSL